METQALDLDALKAEAEQQLAACSSPADIEQFQVAWFGRNGKLTGVLRGVGSMPKDQRKAFGQAANAVKVAIESQTAERLEILEQQALEQELAADESFDPTLPGTRTETGGLHPVTLVQMELEEIFSALGFMILDGPECESDYYNFESLNIPAHHPARDSQDTFYCTNNTLLRTHTSSCQVRTMEQYDPPFRAIFPGRCFRNESVDASHDMMFYQVEGLMVDRDISVANLIAVMKIALSQIFHQDVKVRLRPGYFPFVEPGFELDMEWRRGDRTEWLEMIGCGLVHPNVLRFGGIDPDRWSGFAFGMGLTRLAMIKYNVPDIRLLSSGDLRYLAQFPAG